MTDAYVHAQTTKKCYSSSDDLASCRGLGWGGWDRVHTVLAVVVDYESHEIVIAVDLQGTMKPCG